MAENLHSALDLAVRQIAAATWAGTDGFTSTLAPQVFWRDLVKKVDALDDPFLSLPFWVVSLGKDRPGSGGYATRSLIVPVQVFYIRSSHMTTGERAANVLHAEQPIRGALTDFVAELMDHVDGATPSFTLAGDNPEPLIDTSELCPCNRQFLQRGDQYWGGSVSWDALVGE